MTIIDRAILNLNPEVPYLRERGFADKTVERLGLGLCGRGLLKGCVAIPMFGLHTTINTGDVRPLARASSFKTMMFRLLPRPRQVRGGSMLGNS